MADVKLPEGYVAGAGNPFSSAIENGWFGAGDAFLPGITALNKFFDFNGSSAAQSQFEHQLSLNQQAQSFNASQAERQRAWEQMMSSTQYQRMVADLKAAGLNPYLAISQMSAGGVPSGSAASSSSGSADMANNKLTAAAGILAVALRMILAKH